MSATVSSPSPSGHSPAFVFIFITVLLDMLSVGIIIPVLPKLVLSFLGGEVVRAAPVMGLFMTLWAAAQFVASPVMGSLSDRFGRRPIVLMSNLGLGLDYLVMALAPALWVLFAGRLLSGIFSASVSTAHAYIADITPQHLRAAAFGKLSAAFGAGFVLGPALGGLLGSYDLRLPFFAAAALSLANFVYGYFVLPESLPVSLRAPFQLRTAHPWAALKLLGRTRQLKRLGAIGFLIHLAHNIFPAIAVLYMGYRYQWTERDIGLLLALVGITSMIVQGWMVGPLVKAIGEKAALAVGLLFAVLGMWLYGFASSSTLFIVGTLAMALWNFALPSASALMTREIPPDEQGRLQGANASLSALAGLIAPWTFGYLFAAAINPAMGISLPGLPFYIAAALMGLALAIALSLQGAPQRIAPETV